MEREREALRNETVGKMKGRKGKADGQSVKLSMARKREKRVQNLKINDILELKRNTVRSRIRRICT